MTTQEDKLIEQTKLLAEQAERLNKAAEDRKEALEEELTVKNKLLSVGQSLLGTANDRLEAASSRKKQVLEVQQAEQAAREAEVEHLKKAMAAAADQDEATKRHIQDKLDAADKEYEKTKKRGVALKEQLKSLEAQKGVVESSTSAFASIASNMGISQSQSAGIVKNMASSYMNAVKQDGIIKGTLKSVASLALAFWDVFNPVNLISSAMSAIWKASWEFLIASSEALSNFSAAAGDAGSMAKDVGAAMSLGTGVNIEQAAQAASGLAASWRGFSGASSAARTSMIRTAAELNVLGISAESTGEAIELLTRTMGVSTKQAEKTLKGMASAASSLGTTPAKLQSDLASVQGSLSLYGDRMIDEFYDLAGAAKAAGLEMSDLTALGESFDSFDDASSKAGNLNALLGGPFLDSMEMMRLQAEEGPDAVAYALKDAFAAAGKSYKDMNYMEKKSYAESLNMSADKFDKLMSMSKSEAKAVAKKAKQEAASQKRYQKMLRSTVSLGMQIKNFFQSVFVKGGVVKAIKELIGVLMSSQKGAKSVTDVIAGPMVSAIKFVTKVAKVLVKRFEDDVAPAFKDVGETIGKIFEPSMEGAADAAEGTANVIIDGITSMLKSIDEFIEKAHEWWKSLDPEENNTTDRMTTFFDNAGTKISDFISNTLVQSFEKFKEKIIPTLWDFGFALGATALAVYAFSKVLGMALGWGMLLKVGIVIGLLVVTLQSVAEVAKQVAALFESWGDIFEKAGTAVEKTADSIEKLYGIYEKAGFLGTGGFAVFLTGIALALGKLGSAASNLPHDQFVHLMNTVRSIARNSQDAANSTNNFASAVSSLATALSGIDSDKFGKFSWNLTRTLEATAQVTPASARGAVQVIEEAKEYQKEVVKNKDNVDALAEILKATGAAQPAGAGAGETIIRLEIGGKALNEYIWNAVNGTIDRRR